MINRIDVEKYLGENWKKFRNGETWNDVGLFIDLMRDDVLVCNKFKEFAYKAWLRQEDETFGAPFIFWLFTPERFCKLAIEFLDKEKIDEQK